MGMTHILKTANSGLSVTQTSIDVVARNIANAGTEGYTRKLTTQENLVAGNQGMGARISGVFREVDQYVQQQLFVEDSRLAFANVMANYLGQIDQMFGAPGAANALDTRLNEFSQSLQDLSTQPESAAARAAVVAEAEGIASTLRSLTDGVQGLRQLAEDSIAEGIADLNNLLSRLAEVNNQVASANALGAFPADLLDQRDLLVNKIGEYVEINVREDNQGRAQVFTKTGNVLVDKEAISLSFDRNGNVTAGALYNKDETLRGVGTVTLTGTNGYEIDLIENGILTTGRLGALIELRDETLTEAQRQLDDLAQGLALTLSNSEVDGTAVTAGAASGFDIDISDVSPGNILHLEYTDNSGPTTHKISIVGVRDASNLPLSNDVTPDPDDTVIGVDFSAGDAAIAAALNTALGTDITVTSPAAGTIRIVDDGATNNTDINSLSKYVTATGLQDQGLGMPLFIDTGNNLPYTGAVDGGYTRTGFAGRIVVNGQVTDNPELLIRYNSSPETPIGDNARPLDLIERLNQTTVQFSGDTGLGLASSPYSGTVINFAQNIISYQTSQSSRAELNLTAQEAVTSSLREKYETDTGVNIDEELAALIALQQAFSANARVMAVTGELMDLLIQSV